MSPDGNHEQRAARATELRRLLDYHAHRYYVLDDPEIGDDGYDALLDELRALETADPSLVTPESPTQRVGGEPVSDLVKVEHLQRMLSLANARSGEELAAWIQRMRNHLAREGIEAPEFEFVAEPKIDGLAMSLVYINGVLDRGVTRGNGELGEDVTHNIRTIAQIPGVLDFSVKALVAGGLDEARATELAAAPPVLLEVRGEIYMALADFEQINERRAAAGESTFMNPRNSAAGTIRQLDPRLAAQRPLSFWAYQAGVADGIAFAKHTDALDLFRALGFPVNPDIRVLHSEQAVVEQCQNWLERRGSLPFEIDGVVVKENDLELQRRLGVVGREPRWAIAWKFPPTTAVTTLLDIGWNPGKFGDLHPYAILEPVRVGGVTVKQATLHNEEDLARKDIRIGEEVIVLRAGDVIPQVVSPAPHVAERSERPARPLAPGRCPVCGTETVKHEDSVFTNCPNRSCPGRREQLLTHFAGAMDIDGLGESRVKQFIEWGWVKSAADFYRLNNVRTLLIDKEGWGKLSVDKLLAAIVASKRQPFGRVLFAIGIEEVGDVTGRSLAQQFHTIDMLLGASIEELEATPDVGPIIAKKVHAQLADPSMRALIFDLRECGLRFEETGTPVTEGPLLDKAFVLTGTLPNMTREEASRLIVAAGGRVVSAVSKKTDYVIAGESAGSKLTKAESLGIRVLDESGLRELVG